MPATVKDASLLNDLHARLSEILATSPAADLERNLKALFMAGLDRFDLVTREDFEAQRRVLERTRVRLAEIEARLTELEGQRTPR